MVYEIQPIRLAHTNFDGRSFRGNALLPAILARKLRSVENGAAELVPRPASELQAQHHSATLERSSCNGGPLLPIMNTREPRHTAFKSAAEHSQIEAFGVAHYGAVGLLECLSHVACQQIAMTW